MALSIGPSKQTAKIFCEAE